MSNITNHVPLEVIKTTKAPKTIKSVNTIRILEAVSIDITKPWRTYEHWYLL
ncbi:unnamed protein product [Ixodes persulcatus]